MDATMRFNSLRTLADVLMNRALMCDRADKQDMATAHLEMAMRVMIEEYRDPLLQPRSDSFTANA